MRSVILSALLAFGVVGGASAAVAPVSVSFSPGSVIAPGPLPGRSDPNAALAGPDGVFLSLGFGGVAVFDFGELFGASTIDVTEVTFLQFGPHVETADVLVSATFDGDFGLAGFTSIGSVLNSDAQIAATLDDALPFRYVALADTSPIDGGSFDGFDIDYITVTPIVAPIPVPPAALLFASALVGTVMLTRRKTV